MKVFKRPSRGAIDEFMDAVIRPTAGYGVGFTLIAILMILAGDILKGWYPLMTLTLVFGCFWVGLYLSARARKQAIPEDQLGEIIEKTYGEFKFMALSIVLIGVTFLILYFLPLLIVELDIINFSWPLLEIATWFYLTVGITFCVIAYIFHSRRTILRMERLPCPNCNEPLQYFREEKQYYCEKCQKHYKRKLK